MSFRVLCADPPWSFGDKLPGAARGAAKNYRVLSARDICRFPLPPLAKDAWLFLWRVASMQQEALDVIRMWGFTVKSEIVWEKVTPPGKKTAGGKPWFGMGRYVRASHETCIVAVRGRVKPLARSVRSRFSAPVGRHSEKPEAFYQLVEQLSAGPYVELFGRRSRPGWVVLGDQAPREEAAHAAPVPTVVAAAPSETTTKEPPPEGPAPGGEPGAGGDLR